MTRSTTARWMLSIAALSIVGVTAACSSTQLGGARQPTPQVDGNANVNGYSCYYADKRGGDRVVDGHTVHWCGPVPRPVN
jgi:hypothetical protein